MAEPAFTQYKAQAYPTALSEDYTRFVGPDRFGHTTAIWSKIATQCYAAIVS